MKSSVANTPFGQTPLFPTDPGALFGLGAAVEAQARLWNQLIDASRSFWTVYTPWLQTTPALWGAAVAATPVLVDDEAGFEPAETVDGIPDAFEKQARSWNHFLDAHRSFWTAMTSPVSGLPDAVEEAPAARTASRATPVTRPARKTKPAARRSR